MKEITIKKATIIVIAITLSIFLSSCIKSNEQRSEPFILRDISYSNNKNKFTVYLCENDEYIPYLVLTDDYNGSCLLLRKHVLGEQIKYNDNYRYSSYYKDSNIDAFLNKSFINVFNEAFKKKIIPTEVEITSKGSIGICGTDTEFICRKIFILSVTEVYGYSSSVTSQEGTSIEYFEKNDKKATKIDGIKSNWWLRTPNTWDANTVYGVDINGSVGISGMGDLIEPCIGGVRPALCLNGDIEIQKKNDKYYIK